MFSNFKDNSSDFISTATFTVSNVRYSDLVKWSLVIEQKMCIRDRTGIKLFKRKSIARYYASD